MVRDLCELVGNTWLFGDDIDTDQIISGRYLRILDYSEMAMHAFEVIRPEFAKKVKQDDIIIAGRNFGSGSSREEAPMVLVELGIGCVIAESFARIFYRNAFNVGLPVMIVPEVKMKVNEGQKIKVNLQAGTIKNLESGETLKGEAIPELMLDFIRMGGAISRYLNMNRE
jgi:3-isopropylmalate/(R)-2-methylmalate dehydratase small subunit